MVANAEPRRTRNGHHGRSHRDRTGRSHTSEPSATSKKLRKILQKKQLEELLKSYSSLADDDRGHVQHDRDIFTLARKGSIGGKDPPVTSNDVANHIRNEMNILPDTLVTASVDELDPEGKMPRRAVDEFWSPRAAQAARRKKGHRDDEGDDNSISEAGGKPFIRKRSHYNRRKAIEKHSKSRDPESGDADSGAAVAGNKGDEKTKVAAAVEPPKLGRAAKREVFQSRMGEVNTVVWSFSERAQQRQRELAEDFREATQQVRTHLKFGANALFDDLSEQFDELVQSIFMSDETHDGESRNQDGDGERRPQRSNNDRRHGASDHMDASLSHHEAIQLMNDQVSKVLQPVTDLTDKVRDQAQQVSCIPSQPPEEKYYMTQASF